MSVLCSKHPPSISVHQQLWYVLTSFLLLHQLLQLQRLRKHIRGPLITLKQQMKEISQWNTPLISSTAQVYRQ